MAVVFPSVLLAAVQLFGVTGEDLRARAYFNANNVKVGDPMTLTVDFIGEADFAALHPPALAKAVNGRDWKLDDASAKTETGRRLVRDSFSVQKVAVSRSLTYRVRPLREGVLWFPELVFEYVSPTGGRRRTCTRPVPVHARPGEQVVVEGMSDEDFGKMPDPPALRTEPGPDAPQADGDFAWNWRRALAKPTADAFRDFDCVAGRLNEARCAVLEGDWRRALGVYRRLEWRTGQTPEIESGLRAALARRYQNPAAELPVWRQVFRPVLRHGWKGRCGIVFGGLALLAALFWGLAKAVRRLAAVAVLLGAGLAAPEARAQMPDPFKMMEQLHQEMRQQMQQMQSHFSFSFGGEEQEAPKVEVRATAAFDRAEIKTGEPFNVVLSLDAPKDVTLEDLRFDLSEKFGLTVTGNGVRLGDVASENPSNAVRRISVPLRYDVPFRGDLVFTVGGQCVGRRTLGSGWRKSTFSFSNSFDCRCPSLRLDVKPLPSAGQPADFSGVVASRAALVQMADSLAVGTNDVITLTYALKYDGYCPKDFLPDDVAYEWERGQLPADHPEKQAVVWKAYFVADGAPRTPELTVSYYDTTARAYRRVKAGGQDVRYR